MADAAQLPIIGPYIGIFGGGKKADTTVEGTLRGRYRKLQVRGGQITVISKIRPTSEVPRGLAGDLLNQVFADYLGDWAGDFQRDAGLTNVGPHPPAEVGPLPPPELVNPTPIEIAPPRINLPVDLPEVIVNPPAVSPPPAEIAPPAPLEVPLQAIEFDPYATGQPSVSPSARPRSAPATRSAPRVNPLPAASPFLGNLLGIGSAFALASALAPSVAVAASALPGLRARPAPSTRPGPSPGATPSVPPGSAVDFLNPVVPQIVGPTPALSLGLNSAAKPSPQQETQRDKCKCDEKKKKESKPRQPRTKCFRGTFRQRAKGISYSRGEEIPCDGPAIKTKSQNVRLKSVKGRALKAASKYTKRGKAPKLGDLARDVLGF